jgi:hypothetical protein
MPYFQNCVIVLVGSMLRYKDLELRDTLTNSILGYFLTVYLVENVIYEVICELW